MRGWWVVFALAACGNDKPLEQQTPRDPNATPPPSARQPQAQTQAPTPRAPQSNDAVTPQPFHQQAEGAAKPAEAIVKKYRATWANVHSRPSTCWFFSGPAGRDTPLGEHVEVRIESQHAWVTWSTAAFEGTWGDRSIDVLRLATHSYQGTWVISERLRGTVKEKSIHARYAYEECQEGTTCPGECTITADVLLVEE